jgi:deoxyribose-phosphate aldolase
MHITTDAVCVYPTMVKHAVKGLRGTDIPVASVATGFPAGLISPHLRLEEIRWAIGEGAVSASWRTALSLDETSRRWRWSWRSIVPA